MSCVYLRRFSLYYGQDLISKLREFYRLSDVPVDADGNETHLLQFQESGFRRPKSQIGALVYFYLFLVQSFLIMLVYKFLCCVVNKRNLQGLCL